MPKVIFQFDKEKDLYNIWETANSQSKWYDFKKGLSQNIIDMCNGKKFEECRSKLEKTTKNVYSTGLIEIYIEFLEKAWNKIEKEYFKRMETIFKKKLRRDIIDLFH